MSQIVAACHEKDVTCKVIFENCYLNDEEKIKLCEIAKMCIRDRKLSERIYKCECGNVIDRDLQAALNLKKYGEDVLKRSVA